MTRLEKKEKKELSRKWETCLKKDPYKTMRQAENVCFLMLHQGKAKVNELYAYHCRYCDQYHVGRR